MLLQGYGLSESSPVITISTPTHHRRGSCGRPIPGIEVRIADDGEDSHTWSARHGGLLSKPGGDQDEVLRDGWLATGDLGRLDDDGFLHYWSQKRKSSSHQAGRNPGAGVFGVDLADTEDPLISCRRWY